MINIIGYMFGIFVCSLILAATLGILSLVLLLCISTYRLIKESR